MVTRQYLEERGALEAVARRAREACAGRRRHPDRRSAAEEYLAGHLPGAISMPLGDLRKRLRELVGTRDVVAYCRGPYCVMALDAVEILRRKGLRAHRLELGVPEWRARGWRVETGGDRLAGGQP
jgi:rhodanese-related sulfurtransferase